MKKKQTMPLVSYLMHDEHELDYIIKGGINSFSVTFVSSSKSKLNKSRRN